MRTIACSLAFLVVACVSGSAAAAGAAGPGSAKAIVDATVIPLMKEQHIPGMAVGVIVAGKTYVFDYGVASRETGKPVTRKTLFEIGSTSKTFTATLASYAQVTGKLSLSDTVSRFIPSLRGTAFGSVHLVDLATHTPGGLPLQVPDDIATFADFLSYLKHWKAAYPAGTHRTYSNPGIGILGFVAATSMQKDFVALEQGRLFPALGIRHSYIDVPSIAMPDYAQGYTSKGIPIRMQPGILSAEAYGVKSTADDLVRFVEENMGGVELSGKLKDAIEQTHTGYFLAGGMTQDLIWEQYPYPVELTTLLAGNSTAMAFDPMPVRRIVPPERPRSDVWIDKTGSTNGFGAYVAFVPEKRIGIVLLANENYPIDVRVRAAYRILTRLAAGSSSY